MQQFLQSYLTVQKHAKTEINIQKSRFICQACPTNTEGEAIDFIQSIQSDRHATHHCYAYIMHQQQRFSDDGEPNGTAGRPILETILQNQLLFTSIVITRYFGGVKLGANGLVRAYRQAANEAIQIAGIIQKKLHRKIQLQISYSLWGKIENQVRKHYPIVEQPTFTDQIYWSIWVPFDQEASFINQVSNWSNGQVISQPIQYDYKLVNHSA